MKCALCGSEIEENELHVIRVGVIYHAVVQDCRKKKEEQ
jgi:hypothetical protein